jgi:hypothetical protein
MLDMQIFFTMTNYTIYGFPEKTILTLLNILALKFFWETSIEHHLLQDSLHSRGGNFPFRKPPGSRVTISEL